jgi:hypothetical protein
MREPCVTSLLVLVASGVAVWASGSWMFGPALVNAGAMFLAAGWQANVRPTETPTWVRALLVATLCVTTALIVGLALRELS